MRVDAASRPSIEGSEEQGRAGRRLEDGGFSEIGTGGVLHDEHIGGLHEFLLHAGRGDEDVGAVLNRDAAAGAGDPAEGVEVAAEDTDVVRRVGRGRGGDEGVHAVAAASTGVHDSGMLCALCGGGSFLWGLKKGKSKETKCYAAYMKI